MSYEGEEPPPPLGEHPPSEHGQPIAAALEHGNLRQELGSTFLMLEVRGLELGNGPLGQSSSP